MPRRGSSLLLFPKQSPPSFSAPFFDRDPYWEPERGFASIATNGAYSVYGQERSLYYEYLDTGSVIKFVKSDNDGITWSTISTIATGANDVPLDQAIVVDGQNIYAIYTSNNDDPANPAVLKLKRSTNLGSSWGTEIVLDNGVAHGNNRFYRVFMLADGRGNVIIFYASEHATLFTTDGLWRVLSTDGGASFTAPLQIFTSGVNQTRPMAAIDGDNVNVVWTDSRNGSAYTGSTGDPYYGRLQDRGTTWGNETQLYASNGGTTARAAICAADGKITVAWQDPSNGNEDISKVNSLDNGGTWALARPIPACVASSSQQHPFLIQERNSVWLMWWDNRSGIFQQYAAYSLDYGLTFSKEKLISSITTFDQNIPQPAQTRKHIFSFGIDASDGSAKFTRSSKFYNYAYAPVVDDANRANQGPQPTGWATHSGGTSGLIVLNNELTKASSGGSFARLGGYWTTSFAQGGIAEVWVDFGSLIAVNDTNSAGFNLLLLFADPSLAATWSNRRGWSMEGFANPNGSILVNCTSIGGGAGSWSFTIPKPAKADRIGISFDSEGYVSFWTQNAQGVRTTYRTHHMTDLYDDFTTANGFDTSVIAANVWGALEVIGNQQEYSFNNFAVGTFGMVVTDSGTPILVLSASGSDIYTGSGTAYTDAGTATLVLAPSSSDIAQFVDAATAVLVMAPSSSDTAQFVEASTAVLSLSPSSTDTAQYVESATATVVLAPSSTDIHEIPDSGTATVILSPSSTDTAQFVDSGTATVGLLPSSTDIHEIPDSGTATLVLIHTGEENYERGDAATSSLQLTASGTEGRESADADTAILSLGPSDVSVFGGVDSANASLSLSVDSTDMVGVLDASTATLNLTPSGINTIQAIDADAATVVLVPSSVDIAQYVEGSTATVVLVPSSTDLKQSGNEDSDTITVKLIPSSSDVATYQDTNVANLPLSASSADISSYVDSSQVVLPLTASGSDSISSGATDIGEALLPLSAMSSDLAGYVEISEALLKLTPDVSEEFVQQAILVMTPITSDVANYVDAATAILKMTTTADTFRFAVLLVGIAYRHLLGSAGIRYGAGIPFRRYWSQSRG